MPDSWDTLPAHLLQKASTRKRKRPEIFTPAATFDSNPQQQQHNNNTKKSTSTASLVPTKKAKADLKPKKASTKDAQKRNLRGINSLEGLSTSSRQKNGHKSRSKTPVKRNPRNTRKPTGVNGGGKEGDSQGRRRSSRSVVAIERLQVGDVVISKSTTADNVDQYNDRSSSKRKSAPKSTRSGRSSRNNATSRRQKEVKKKRVSKAKKIPKKPKISPRIFNWEDKLEEINNSDALEVIQNNENFPAIVLLLNCLRSSLGLKKTKYTLAGLELGFQNIEGSRLMDEMVTRMVVSEKELKLIQPGMGYPSEKWKDMLKEHLSAMYTKWNDMKSLYERSHATYQNAMENSSNSNSNSNSNLIEEDDDMDLDSDSEDDAIKSIDVVVLSSQELSELESNYTLMNNVIECLGEKNPLESKSFFDCSNAMQLLIFKVVLDWRLTYSEKASYEIREMDPNQIRIELLGTDGDGNEYYTIPGFTHHDTRVYIVPRDTRKKGFKEELQDPELQFWRLLFKDPDEMPSFLRKLKSSGRPADNRLLKIMKQHHQLGVEAKNRLKKAAEKQERLNVLEKMDKKRSSRIASLEMYRVNKNQMNEDAVRLREIEHRARLDKIKKARELKIKQQEEERKLAAENRIKSIKVGRRERLRARSAYKRRVIESEQLIKRRQTSVGVTDEVIARLKSDHQELLDSEVFCICNKACEGKFMLECDSCNDWFHGECVGIEEVELSDKATFLCPQCNNPDYEAKLTDPELGKRMKAAARARKEALLAAEQKKAAKKARKPKPQKKPVASMSTSNGAVKPKKTGRSRGRPKKNSVAGPVVAAQLHDTNLAANTVVNGGRPGSVPMTPAIAQFTHDALRAILIPPSTVEEAQRRQMYIQKCQNDPVLFEYVKYALVENQKKTIALNQQRQMQALATAQAQAQAQVQVQMAAQGTAIHNLSSKPNGHQPYQDKSIDTSLCNNTATTSATTKNSGDSNSKGSISGGVALSNEKLSSSLSVASPTVGASNSHMNLSNSKNNGNNHSVGDKKNPSLILHNTKAHTTVTMSNIESGDSSLKPVSNNRHDVLPGASNGNPTLVGKSGSHSIAGMHTKQGQETIPSALSRMSTVFGPM